MAVDVERHRRPRVPGALGELPCGDARLVPDRDPAVPKIVRVVVGDLRVATRPRHRLTRGRLRDPLEHPPLGNPIFERARLLDRRHEPLRQVHPARTITLGRGPR